MPTKTRTKSKTNILSVLLNKSIRDKYTFVVTANEMFYCFGNEKIPARDFERLLPIEVKRFSVKGELIGKGNL